MERTTRPQILVVDDIDSLRKVVRDVLEEQYTISDASNGVEALEFLRDNTPDLVLCDISMPKMNGFEVLERMSADERMREIPLILITSIEDPAEKARGFELGAVDFITKPFVPVELKARIKTHLTLKKAKDPV